MFYFDKLKQTCNYFLQIDESLRFCTLMSQYPHTSKFSMCMLAQKQKDKRIFTDNLIKKLYDPLTVFGRSDKFSVKFLVQRVANSPNQESNKNYKNQFFEFTRFIVLLQIHNVFGSLHRPQNVTVESQTIFKYLHKFAVS